MQLTDIFNLSLIGRAKETAIEFDDATGKSSPLTFGELDARSNQLANLFASRGLKRGDRLGFFLSNCVEIVDIFLPV
jgi:acyl-coenzyme A synthetase/AMP-(fatty) acid ligase